MTILKKTFMIFILLFSIVSIVNAVEFYAQFTPISQKILKGETGEYEISIFNKGNVSEEFRIYSLNYPDWDIYTEPIINPITVLVGPKKSVITTIRLDPLNKEIIGSYIVPINIQAKSTEEKVSVKLPITVTSNEDKPGEYVPTILTDIDLPKVINPSEKISIRIKLSNQNILDLPDIELKIESTMFSEVIKTSLGPKEEKTIERTIKIDPKTPPKKDTIRITGFRGNETIISPINTRVEVLPINNILKKINSDQQFLKVRKEIIFTNEGNVKYVGPALIESTFFRRIFSTTHPKAHIEKVEGINYFKWDIELEPDASVTYYINENFYMLFVVIILSFLIIFGYFQSRSPLILQKTGSDIMTKEGGIHELKIMIHVKNRGQKALTHLEVKDKIPHLVQLEKGVSLGTLQPSKLVHQGHKGAIAIWNIEKLDPNEERVINYKASTHMSILGSFILPHAVAKFHEGKKQKKSHSNKYTVSSK